MTPPRNIFQICYILYNDFIWIYRNLLPSWTSNLERKFLMLAVESVEVPFIWLKWVADLIKKMLHIFFDLNYLGL